MPNVFIAGVTGYLGSRLADVSVAHPAPTMKAYIEVRTRCEELIRTSGLHATILRPWYVLGPGHYWSYLLKPFYWMARQIPASRAGAKTRPGHANTDDLCAGRQRGLARRWNSNRGSPRDCLAMSVKLVSANRSFPPALTAESRTDPCQGRSLNFQVHGNMGESFQLTP